MIENTEYNFYVLLLSADSSEISIFFFEGVKDFELRILLRQLFRSGVRILLGPSISSLLSLKNGFIII